jgi:hypothetical protein
MVTRNKAITVTGLHMLLQLTGRCYQKQDHQININFVEDTKSLQRLIRQGERVLWVNYGCCLDNGSFEMIFDSAPGREVLVFPVVTEGIDWNQFRKAVKADSKEPIHQLGLHFDTELGTKVSDGIWTVTKSAPQVFVIDGKAVCKKMKTKDGLKLPRDVDQIFERMMAAGVKVQAWTKANVLVHYTHECLGNILEATGVSCKQGD